ncbi:MAG TPA: DUF4097 family beta strand repeat-containing protein [Pyrinomonadaceae bacterium]|nr:DUF4097 family beta strand repeat-containing protein [Pyrinomonadaceae bacterium]
MSKSLRHLSFALALLALAAAAVVAQDKDKSDKSKFDKKYESSLECREYRDSDRLFGHCEIKEQTLAAGGAITVDGKQNGGISIKGWDRNEILVRAKVETRAPTPAEANVLAQQVRIETAALNIHAEGPESRNDYQWYVSFEIFVPRRSDLSLTAHNGGISIREVSGRIEFQTLNGGVSLTRVGGAVRGSTTNGGVHVELAGARWDGEELNVRTTNGGVNLVMPDNYSAHLETSTVNGNVSSDFPLNVPMTSRGRMPKEISVDLGAGGPTIRATTTNGGVRVGRASAM